MIPRHLFRFPFFLFVFLLFHFVSGAFVLFDIGVQGISSTAGSGSLGKGESGPSHGSKEAYLYTYSTSFHRPVLVSFLLSSAVVGNGRGSGN
jgi:hypothetical protein